MMIFVVGATISVAQVKATEMIAQVKATEMIAQVRATEMVALHIGNDFCSEFRTF